MSAARFQIISILALGAGALFGTATTCRAQAKLNSSQIRAADLNKEIRDFLAREVSAHVADIKTLDPAPDRVVGALISGLARQMLQAVQIARAKN